MGEQKRTPRAWRGVGARTEPSGLVGRLGEVLGGVYLLSFIIINEDRPQAAGMRYRDWLRATGGHGESRSHSYRSIGPRDLPSLPLVRPRPMGTLL